MDGQRDKLSAALDQIHSLKSQLKTLREMDWGKERAELLARIRGLENENASLREAEELRAGASPTGSSSAKGKGTDTDAVDKDSGKKVRFAFLSQTGPRHDTDGGAPDDNSSSSDTVTLARSELEAAERKYGLLEAQLKAERLKSRSFAAARVGADPPDPLCPPAAAAAAATAAAQIVDEEKLKTQWKTLKDAIRKLCDDEFSKRTSAAQVEDPTVLSELAALSKNHNRYRTGEASHDPSHLFQAAIWRHLHHRIFERATRCWGEDVYQQFKVFSAMVRGVGGITEEEYEQWRIFTGTLLHASHPLSSDSIDSQAEKINTAISKFANEHSEEESKKLLERMRDIVRMAAELGTTIATSTILTLTSNRPGSYDPYGFSFNSEIMEKTAVCGDGEVVGMIVSPILLKKQENGDFKLLEMAGAVVGDLA